jgi:F-type H+-transporting ATPase subunit gamma
MSGKNEIRGKIASIKDTQKITKAMEMVAASKMRKTQERMRKTRPYRERMASIIGHLAKANPEYRHPYIMERPVKRVGVIVISSDRGLCGGLNSNLFRALVKRMKVWGENGQEIKLGLLGRKAVGFFSMANADIVAQKVNTGDMPGADTVAGVTGAMLKMYDAGEIDEIYLASNHFVNVVVQEPKVIKILPVKTADLAGDTVLNARPYSWDYVYEPDPKPILDGLLVRYVESLVFQGLVENVAAEQAAKMVAMKNASENAGELIKELKQVYNRARQAAITQEIAEIVAGAAAV